MNMNRNPNDLPKLAGELEKAISSRLRELSKSIHLVETDINEINQLHLLSEEAERKIFLSESKSSLLQAEELYRRIRRTSGFAGIRTPLTRFRQWQAVRKAKKNYAVAEADYDEPAKSAERKKHIEQYNQKVKLKKLRLSNLTDQKEKIKATKSSFDHFSNLVNEAIQAARGDGWKAFDFENHFREVIKLVNNNDIYQAQEILCKLKFQRQPSPSRYAEWGQEATNLLQSAHQQHAGMMASTAYTEIACNSILLATPMLKNETLNRLTPHNTPAEQWHSLSECLTDPKSLKTDALWAIYWAMYQCGQWVASATSESDVHEDVLTGKVAAQVDRWLTDWATKRINQFGYPEVNSYMGTLEIASTTEETRLGADIGLIVDLNIGSLVCRKVALFQAKKSLSGIANIGSDSGQLEKVSISQNIGFYLFYHLSTYPAKGQAPSVCSANELKNEINQSGKKIDADYLPINTYTKGWDWASFISFGLCNPSSNIGESFSTFEEAFTILGNGDPRNLPKYLHIISLADEQQIKELRFKIHMYYREIEKTINKKKNPHRTRGMNGPSM